MFLRRPHGTLGLIYAISFPTLKRGANNLCASGAAAIGSLGAICLNRNFNDSSLIYCLWLKAWLKQERK